MRVFENKNTLKVFNFRTNILMRMIDTLFQPPQLDPTSVLNLIYVKYSL